MNFKELFNKGFLVIFVRIGGAAITFFSVLFLARILDTEAFGTYSLSLTIITLVSVFARFGLDNVNLKQVASYLEESEDVALGYIYTSFKLIVIIGTALSLIIFFYSNEIAYYIFNKPSLEKPLHYFSFLIVPSALLYLFAAVFKSFGQPVYSIFVQNILVPLFLIIFVCLIYIFNFLSITNIIFIIISSHIIAIIIFFITLHKKHPISSVNKIPFQKLIYEGWPMLLISSGSLIMGYTDIIILGIFCSESDVGIYTVASKSVMIASLILVAINSITAPLYAKYFYQKDIHSLEYLAKQTSVLLLIIAISFFCIFYIFATYIMGWFGSTYIKGSSILIVLSVGQFFIVASGSVSYLLSMTGKENTFKNILLVSAALNIILNLILVKTMGAIGVAYATVLSTFIWNIWSMYAVKRHLGFWTLNIFSLLKGKRKEVT